MMLVGDNKLAAEQPFQLSYLPFQLTELARSSSEWTA
jgi:hypothetical protein